MQINRICKSRDKTAKRLDSQPNHIKIKFEINHRNMHEITLTVISSGWLCKEVSVWVTGALCKTWNGQDWLEIEWSGMEWNGIKQKHNYHISYTDIKILVLVKG